jgi:fumarate hydratase subunit beta
MQRTKDLLDALQTGKKLPFGPEGTDHLLLVGRHLLLPAGVIGACGPTTSSGWIIYTPKLLMIGLRGMIGRGKDSPAVKEAMKQHKAVYFGATGGAGALLSGCVVSSEVIAYEDLGPEAVVKLHVRDMPLFVINDIYGNDLYETGMERYRK